MSIRDIQLPRDIIPLGQLIASSFHYPENEHWSVQTDEKEYILETVGNLHRIWPLIRMAGFFSSAVRDLLRGCVWEEDGAIVGVTMVQRHGVTHTWIVGTVAVLPEYRRRGIARKLVERGLEIIRDAGGKTAWLSVIDGNLPAHTLYARLGFETYSGQIEFEAFPDEPTLMPQLPIGYFQSDLRKFDWQPRFELEKRLVPANMHTYEPVEAGRFRQPLMIRLLYPLLMFAQGVREENFLIRSAADGQIIGRGEYSIPLREKGFNALWARLDPAHAALAPYLVRYLLHRVTSVASGRRVEMSVPVWMDAVAAAALESGFERRKAYHRMGIAL